MAEKYNDYEEYGENENGGDTEPSKTKMILFVAVAFLMVAAAVLFFVAQRSGDSESAQTGDQEKSDQGAKKMAPANIPRPTPEAPRSYRTVIKNIIIPRLRLAIAPD